MSISPLERERILQSRLNAMDEQQIARERVSRDTIETLNSSLQECGEEVRECRKLAAPNTTKEKDCFLVIWWKAIVNFFKQLFR